MSTSRLLLAGLVVSTLGIGTAPPAAAGGGEFVGGVIGGVILKTIIDENARNRRAPAPRQATRRVQDPAVTDYWFTVQSALNEIGYNVGRADGIAGSRTRSAVRDFQRSLGVEPTGTLSAEEHARLMQLAGYAPAPEASTGFADPGLLPPAGGPPEMEEPDLPTGPAGAAAPLVVTSAPASAAALSAFDAPKRLDDAALDEIAAATSVLGIGIGSPRAEADAAFAEAVGACKTTGAYTACAGGNETYSDDVAFATAGTDAAAPVYFVTRTLGFNQPVPVDALRGKLAETLGPVTDDDDMIVSSSGECDRVLAGDGAAETAAAVRAHARSGTIGEPADVSVKCRAFFAVALDGDGQAAGKVTIRLYDGRLLEPPATAEAQLDPAPPAAPTVAVRPADGTSRARVPDGVKF